jgi:hypothetical protein
MSATPHPSRRAHHWPLAQSLHELRPVAAELARTNSTSNDTTLAIAKKKKKKKRNNCRRKP